MVKLGTSRVARSSRIDGGSGRTHARTRRPQEHKHDTKTHFPHRSVQTGPIESQRERLASRYKKGSWMFVSPTVNRTAPIKSPEDERLASSQTTSRGLESTRGIFSTRGGLESARESSPQGEATPQGVGKEPMLNSLSS